LRDANALVSGRDGYPELSPSAGTARTARAMPDAVNLSLDSRRIGAGTMVDEFERRKNRVRAKVRAKIKHPYRILKRVFGFVQACFPGLHATSSD